MTALNEMDREEFKRLEREEFHNLSEENFALLLEEHKEERPAFATITGWEMNSDMSNYAPVILVDLSIDERLLEIHMRRIVAEYGDNLYGEMREDFLNGTWTPIDDLRRGLEDELNDTANGLAMRNYFFAPDPAMLSIAPRVEPFGKKEEDRFEELREEYLRCEKEGELFEHDGDTIYHSISTVNPHPTEEEVAEEEAFRKEERKKEALRKGAFVTKQVVTQHPYKEVVVEVNLGSGPVKTDARIYDQSIITDQHGTQHVLSGNKSALVIILNHN